MSCGEMSYRATKTWPAESGTTMGSAPSQPCSSPPNVSRQPTSQPVPAAGECGQRSSICSGSMLEPYAAYRLLAAVLIPGSLTEPLPALRFSGRMGCVTRICIVGGGPAGYESALVAAQLGAEVTVIDRDGLG